VVNASISGDTTSGGRSRLPALLAQHKPTHVVLELGANDALRGLRCPAPRTTSADDPVGAAARGAVAAGGHAAAAQLRQRLREPLLRSFAKVAKQYKAGSCPSCCRAWPMSPSRAPVPVRRHPSEEVAQPRMLDNVWPELKKLLT
jgi:acyl-CoA thioesterase-1